MLVGVWSGEPRRGVVSGHPWANHGTGQLMLLVDRGVRGPGATTRRAEGESLKVCFSWERLSTDAGWWLSW
jgi:hypothetical protein